jgi:predicted O-methyltransferase YrrM
MIAIALATFTKYEVTNLVKLVEGPAANTLKGIRGEFDIIFIDADKPGYKTYLEIILEKGLLSKNGIIITDNSTPPTPNSFYWICVETIPSPVFTSQTF